jgi:catechol 2,3-dioxygenase-like lactoylglutathione lyase family enzyme
MQQKVDSAIKPKFLSHGTLISKDLERSRKFYTEFLGLEVIRTSPISMMTRLGGSHVYAVVEQKNHDEKMRYLFHNGLDLDTQADVEEAHRITVEQAEKWGIQDISKPIKQHGTFSFYFWDIDGNCWEFLSNPEGGYTWIFEQGDQEGKGHMAKTFERPGLTT